MIRRALFCLIVGVTAFGVSGWMLRPKPNWTTAMAKHAGCTVTGFHILESNEHAPIWMIWLCTSLTGDWNDDCRLVALDPATGATMATIHRNRWLIQSAELLGDGAVLIVDRRNGSQGTESKYEYFDGRSDESSMTLELKGRWRTAPRLNSLWRLTPNKDGLRFEQLELPSGRTIREFDCPGASPETDEDECALSVDGKWLAFWERTQGRESAKRAIEIWDVSTGSRLRTVLMPSAQAGDTDRATNDERMTLEFDGSRLVVRLPDERRGVGNWEKWSVLSRGGEFVPKASPAPTAPVNGMKVVKGFDDFNADRTIWSAQAKDRDSSWFCIRHEGNEAGIWRKTPFPVRPRYGSEGADRYAAHSVIGVPAKDEVVCNAIEPSIASLLPDDLRGRLPAEWNKRESIRTRWHDWRRNEWRDVGCSENELHWQIRPHAYVSFVSGSQTDFILQSWPLPPRDPKWPAAAIALAATAGMWWGLGRLAERRRRLRMPT